MKLRTFCIKIYKMVKKCWIGDLRRDQFPPEPILKAESKTLLSIWYVVCALPGQSGLCLSLVDN